MPLYLKAIYFGASALAVVAFVLGLYEVVIAGKSDAGIVSDVLVPMVVFFIVLALYKRRKKGIESRQQQRPSA